MRTNTRLAVAAVVALALLAGCSTAEEAADSTVDGVAASSSADDTTGDGADGTGVPGGGVTPDNPDDPDAADPPGTGTIPATLVIDGETMQAEACEVVGGAVRVRAGTSPVDPGVVVEGGADGATMTMLGLDGPVEALSVEFEAVADDADEYRGTFDPADTDGIETIDASYNVGTLPCPDIPVS